MTVEIPEHADMSCVEAQTLTLTLNPEQLANRDRTSPTGRMAAYAVVVGG